MTNIDDGFIRINDTAGKTVFCALVPGHPGIPMFMGNYRPPIFIHGGKGLIQTSGPIISKQNIYAGGDTDGDLVIFPANVTGITDLSKATLHFDGESAKLWIGSKNKDGEIVIFPSTTTDNHDNSQATILMDGEKGNISIKGDLECQKADCAEEFDTSDSSLVEPGTVMIIHHDGRLENSIKPYDKRVAGVVSGARDYEPAILLDRRCSSQNNVRVPVALVGKVYCKADANYSQIKVGDMLTTSSTPGHAMKATNRSKAFGAVIGKALHPLKSGKDLIPILIALQ